MNFFDDPSFGDPITPLKPEQIGILYRVDHGHVHGLREKLKAARRDCPVVWLTERNKNAKERVGEPGLKILTMHSSKGPQFRAVILMFADDCPADFPDTTEEEERRLF